MPAGSPIGSGQGVLNRNNIVLCLELLKQGDATYPVIVDAGVGSRAMSRIAMELGADGVLLNTAIAHAKDPVMMAHAMRHACDRGAPELSRGAHPEEAVRDGQQPVGGVSYIPGEYIPGECGCSTGRHDSPDAKPSDVD
jgi:thiazole synthase